MIYAGQDGVEAPPIPMGEGHEMSMAGMRVPTQLPSGEWLPQGHRDARMAPMQEFMQPLPVAGSGRGGAR